MPINSITNVNFCAKIENNYYLKNNVSNIIKNGSLEDKNKLLNFMNVIKNDNSMNTFKMNLNILSYVNNIVEYIFTINYGKKIYKNGPINNLSVVNHEFDNYFLDALGYFIKEHYGENFYEKTVNKIPEYLKQYLCVLENTKKQLNNDIMDTFKLES